jgi:hypothetical protein
MDAHFPLIEKEEEQNMKIDRELKDEIDSDAGRITDLMWAAGELLEQGSAGKHSPQRDAAVWYITESAREIAERIAERIDKSRHE